MRVPRTMALLSALCIGLLLNSSTVADSVAQTLPEADALIGDAVSFPPEAITATEPAQPAATGSENLNGKQEQIILAVVNFVRSQGFQCGSTFYQPAPPLQWNAQLEEAAQKHSDDMADNNNFNHIGTDGSDPGDRLRAAGYDWRTYGENIAAGYSTILSVLQGWLGSSGHCRNIMNPNFEHMAIAKATNSRSTYDVYWTQVFGAE